MEINFPETGIRVKLDWCMIWISFYSFFKTIQIHIHFSPDTDIVRREIYKSLYPYLKPEDQNDGLARFILNYIREHEYDVGCIKFPILNRENKKIFEIANIRDIDKQNEEWNLFLKEVF